MRYHLSETVREFLVLQALASTVDGFNEDLAAEKDVAFVRLIGAIRTGEVELDFKPHEIRVDVPRLGHPHHMQALLYWCSAFDCDLGRLAEALAFAGRAPTRELVRELIGHIKEDEDGSTLDTANLHFYAATRPSSLEARRALPI